MDGIVGNVGHKPAVVVVNYRKFPTVNFTHLYHPLLIVFTAILWYNKNVEIRDNKGRFVKGQKYSEATQFKKGEHWRPRKPYWEYDWLYHEYVTLNRPAADIAKQFGIHENGILFWLRKLNIPRRDMVTIRKRKYWGSTKEQNGMYGRKGEKSPAWKGGCTPERQSFYASEDWAEVSKEIWKRDNYKCRRCGCKSIYKKRTLQIHHIISFANKDSRKNIHNLILLCPKCHRFVHGKRNIKRLFLGQLVVC